jgi:hypothetical protein
MGSISSAFALAAFAGGLFCRRLSAALVVGGIIALLYATLVVIGLWPALADANLPYLLGALMAFCFAIALPALLACFLRRCVGRMVGGEMTEVR